MSGGRLFQSYNLEQRRFTTSEVAADWQWLQYRGARSGSPEPALTDKLTYTNTVPDKMKMPVAQSTHTSF